MVRTACTAPLTDDLRARVVAALPGLPLGDVLGGGAGGWVVAARDASDGEALAVKIVECDRSSPSWSEGIRVEAEILTRCRHPHLIRGVDFHEVDDLFVLVMERFDGPTVLDRQRSDGLSVRATCEVAIAAARALQCVHEYGFLHGDVKPDNVLYDERGRRHRLIDLGLARRWPLTRGRLFTGTPEYMAPEAIVEGGVVVPATDIYALGVMTYELLAGVLPFLAADSRDAVLRMHVRGSPLPLRAVAPAVPPALAELVMGALSRRVEDRPASAGEFADRLADFVQRDDFSFHSTSNAQANRFRAGQWGGDRP